MYESYKQQPRSNVSQDPVYHSKPNHEQQEQPLNAAAQQFMMTFNMHCQLPVNTEGSGSAKCSDFGTGLIRQLNSVHGWLSQSSC